MPCDATHIVRAFSCFATVCLVVALGPVHSFADDDDSTDPDQAYSDAFTGAFYEFGVRGGYSGGGRTDYFGPSFDAGFRHSFPMLLADSRLSYRIDLLGTETSGLPDSLERHSISLHTNLHPFYFFLLGSDWPAYVFSSIYFEIGIGGQFAFLDARSQRGEYETDFGLLWSLGGGFDIPLWDPDTGKALWLNAVYRYEFAGFDRPADPHVDLNRHTVLVGLGWRVNGLLF